MSGILEQLQNLPILKGGIGFREPMLADLFKNRTAVDFAEVVADRYLAAPPEKLRELE